MTEVRNARKSPQSFPRSLSSAKAAERESTSGIPIIPAKAGIHVSSLPKLSTDLIPAYGGLACAWNGIPAQMSPPHRILTAAGNLGRILFRRNKPGMLLKTKGRCCKPDRKAGMFMKKKVLSHSWRECY
jgi:hypothetical protein